MSVTNITDLLGENILYLAILSAIILILWRRWTFPTDSSGIPSIKPSIPVVGHALGIIRHKTKYLDMLSTKHRLPIFSIPIFTGKVYVITSPDLVQSALCNRALSFDPFSIAFTKRVLGVKGKTFDELTKIPKSDRDVCYNNDIHKIYHTPWMPGPTLQKMNAHMLQEVSAFVNRIGVEYERKDLYEWVSDSFTLTMNNTLYGSRGPVAKDLSLIKALWEFEADVGMLMIDFLPNLTATKAYSARKNLQSAFRAYFHAGYDLDDDVSPFIKGLTTVQRNWGLGNDHHGDFAMVMLMASTTNAVPSIFWFIVYVFSQPSLIREIQEEVMRVTTSKTSSEGHVSMTIKVSKFQQQCPLLCSTCQEVMRVSNRQISFRAAVDDTTISSSEGKFSLKKDSVVFMPSSLQHTSAGVWGPDSEIFNARRFMKQDLPDGKKSAEEREAEKLQKKAFFPFGAGRHYCPGRHFAFTEMVAVISVLTLGFDIVMDDGEKGSRCEPLKIPERRYRSFGEAIPKPVEEMNVYMRRRRGFEDVSWVLDVGNTEDNE